MSVSPSAVGEPHAALREQSGVRTQSWRRVRASGLEVGTRVPRVRWTLAWPAFAVAAIGGIGLTQLGARQLAFTPCSSVRQCEIVVTRAQTQWERCFLFCGAERQRLQEARTSLVRSMEKEAELRHYQARNRVEQQQAKERKAQRIELERRDREERGRVSQLEHERKLELLAIVQANEDRYRLKQGVRTQQYLRALGVAGREARLRRCHRQRAECDNLVLQLVVASEGPEERRSISVLHEYLLGGPVELTVSNSPEEKKSSPTNLLKTDPHLNSVTPQVQGGGQELATSSGA